MSLGHIKDDIQIQKNPTKWLLLQLLPPTPITTMI